VAIPRAPYMTRPTYLGLHHAAYELGDPSVEGFVAPGISVSKPIHSSGLDDRKTLLSQLDQWKQSAEVSEQLNATDSFREQAFQLISNRRTAEAFDLTSEKSDLRDRYGRNLWGQGCLMARRLAEAGAAVVNLYIDTPRSGQEFTNWDDHILNAGRPGHFADYMRVRLPYMDHALATLIEDIFERQIDHKIMVVVVGEFGRTPRLNSSSNGVGRDHWPQAYTALVSGGGLKMGQVVGATNSKAEYPALRPYAPQDLLATIYRHLQIDYRRTFIDHAGRPFSILSDGSPIPELI
ncbi:MAG: DUF1501 domain-containing protein, partial [Planctomycetes bacterium]|nr:DUF1501 domain-containing protein [Planctomycetota bacterium]